MLDAVYTLSQLAGVDPDENDIISIFIADKALVVRYRDPQGAYRHITKPYNLD
jgi:hypothetical protein